MTSMRRTRIVATLGPSTDDPAVLQELIEAGVEVVRINFSHGDLEEKHRQIERVRAIETNIGRNVAILQDLQGPKIRVGDLAHSLGLTAGQVLDIVPEGKVRGDSQISTNYPQLAAEVQPGDSIFLDDGAMELRVSSVSEDDVRCDVVSGGELEAHKGVNLPGVAISAPALTEKDLNDLKFGLEAGVDFVAMSFVRRAEDALGARKLMQETGTQVPLFAKVEKREALDSLDSILNAFDGVMVARGDLGVELGPEKVPGAQKHIIKSAVNLGLPVITATQMLESMTFNRHATRAEASDVANAVLDGTDAVMLSGETAVGQHPAEVVRTMDRIIREAEQLVDVERQPVILQESSNRAFCAAAIFLAAEVGAVALAALSRSGETAAILSSLRSRMPVFALCEDEQSARRLCMRRGIWPIVVGRSRSDEEASDQIARGLVESGALPRGSQVVIVGAATGGPAGETNFVRLIHL